MSVYSFLHGSPLISVQVSTGLGGYIHSHDLPASGCVRGSGAPFKGLSKVALPASV